MGGNRNKKAK